MSGHKFSRRIRFPSGPARRLWHDEGGMMKAEFDTRNSSFIVHRSSFRTGLALFSFFLLMLGLPAGGVLGGGGAAQAAPGGSEPAQDAVIRQVSIDGAGVITYIKSDGIYTFGRAGGVRRQVKVGDKAPRAEGAFAQFLDVSSATLNTGILGLGNDLRIAFRATIEGGKVSEGIFLFTENRGVEAIALAGDIAPDTGGGGFSEFPGRVLISSLGTIMFRATVMGGKASEGIFYVPHGFIAGEASINSVVVQGQAATDTGGGSYAGFGEYTLTETSLPVPVVPFILQVDLFAYIANVQGGGVPQGLYLSTFVVAAAAPLRLELQPTALAVVGKDAAGLRGKSTYAEFEDVVLTNKPEVVFRAKLAGGDAPEGIFQIAFLGPIQLATTRVLAGDRAPVPGANVKFAQFSRMAGNNSEQLVYAGTLQGNGPSQALFIVTLGPVTLNSETLGVGDQAPGTDGGTFSSFGPLCINDDGFISVQAELNGGKMSEAVFSILAKRARFIDGIPR